MMERVNRNGATYWVGYAQFGKRRYSFDAGLTWGRSVATARALLARVRGQAVTE